MSEIIDVPMKGQRSLATVTAEIRSYQDAARRMMVTYIIEIGRRLVEAKSMVAHGAWESYLREELGFSQSTASNYMKIFEAYAAGQMTLEGAALKSQAFANLSYTQALELLALPAEEREEFAETHDLSNMSTRELREELRKRQQAQDGDDEGALLAEQFGTRAPDKAQEDNAAAEAEAELLREKLEAAQKDRQEAISQMDQAQMQGEEYRRRAIKAEEELEFATKVKDALKAKSDEAERQAQAAAEELTKAKAELAEARKAEADAVKKLNAAKADRSVPKETLEKLRKEAEATAEAAYKADYEKLDQAQKNATRAENEATKARQEAKEASGRLAALQVEKEKADKQCLSLQAELRLAAPELAVFRASFERIQTDLMDLIRSVDKLPEEKQVGARRGLAAMLQQMHERIGGGENA